MNWISINCTYKHNKLHWNQFTLKVFHNEFTSQCIHNEWLSISHFWRWLGQVGVSVFNNHFFLCAISCMCAIRFCLGKRDLELETARQEHHQNVRRLVVGTSRILGKHATARMGDSLDSSNWNCFRFHLEWYLNALLHPLLLYVSSSRVHVHKFDLYCTEINVVFHNKPLRYLQLSRITPML